MQAAVEGTDVAPEGPPAKLLPEDPGPNAIKVSATSRVSGVAGKVAHTVRGGALPIVMTAGRGSINQVGGG